MPHSSISEPHQRFRVRDISAWFERPTFDILFFDEEAGVERCSTAVWDDRILAEVEASRMDRTGYRPSHWDVLDVVSCKVASR